jgi:hypothetical protein
MSDSESLDDATSAGNTSHSSWVDMRSADAASSNGSLLDKEDWSDMTDLDLDSLSISSRSSIGSNDITPEISHAKASLPKSLRQSRQNKLLAKQQRQPSHVRNVLVGRRKLRRAENDSLRHYVPSSLSDVPEGSEAESGFVRHSSSFPAPQV